MDTPLLANSPYRIVPGTKLVHVKDGLWAVDAAGTRRQRLFCSVEPVLLSAAELPEVFAPLIAGEDAALGGRLLPPGSCPEHVIAALLREQALVRAPHDVPASEEELRVIVKSGRSGVLLIAMGHASYGRLAAALAATIKATSPGVPVALAWSGDVLTGIGGSKDLFDHFVSVDAVLSNELGRHNPFYAKLCANKLTPFDQTLFIDADSLIYPGADVRTEFLRYQSHDFVPTTSLVWHPDALPSDAYFMCWAPLQPIVKYFGLTRPILQAHSYYFFFASTARAKDVFECARQAYRSLESDTKNFEPRHVQDELALGIATSMLGVPPYSVQHQPLLETGLFRQGPQLGIEACYLGFTVIGYTTTWSDHYRQTLANHGLGDRGYELDKGPQRAPQGRTHVPVSIP